MARISMNYLTSLNRATSRVFFFAFVLLSLTVSYGVAEASTGLTIQPVKVSYTINPGEKVTGTITLTNAASAAMVYSSIEDFIPTAGSSGIQFVGRAPGVTSVRDWITLDSSKDFSFKVSETKDITFTISVPKDAEPGSHFGVIFFKAVDEKAVSAQLKIGTQIGMLVLVTVPGNRLQQGRIDAFSAPGFVQKGPVSFTISFENTGTVYFEPKGEIVVRNIFGKIVATVPVEGQVVLPTGVRDISVVWPAGFILGPYSAGLSLYDGDHNLLTADTIHFFALPIWYLLSFIVILVALYAILVFLKHKVNFSVSLKK